MKNEWYEKYETCRHGQDIPSEVVCNACKTSSEYQPTYATLGAEVARLKALLTEVLGEGDQRYHAAIEKYVCQHCGEICETKFCQEEDCPGRKARDALGEEMKDDKGN